MYPLLLKPVIKDYLWGGTRLKTDFGMQTDTDRAAEAWMLCCRSDGMNTVANGEYAGKTLEQVLNIWGDTCLGKNAKNFCYFPLLIKLIDAKQKLSVQVHPDDTYAMQKEGEYGKTEMWYVVDCKEGAKLIYGFKEQLSKTEFEEKIKDNSLLEKCNFVDVHKGDVFFIPSGTLHAIGEGILVAEVQQNSNTTYRVSDYGRVGDDGKPRELHIDKALDVTNCNPPHLPYGNVGDVAVTGDTRIRDLAKCDKFTAKLLDINGSLEFVCDDSFVSLVVLEGTLNVCYDNEILEAQKGDSIFIPSALKVSLCGKCNVLLSRV